MSYYLSGLPPQTYCSTLLNFTISFFPPILSFKLFVYCGSRGNVTIIN